MARNREQERQHAQRRRDRIRLRTPESFPEVLFDSAKVLKQLAMEFPGETVRVVSQYAFDTAGEIERLRRFWRELRVSLRENPQHPLSEVGHYHCHFRALPTLTGKRRFAIIGSKPVTDEWVYKVLSKTS